MALKAGRVGVYPEDLDNEGHIKQNEVDPYVLPIATSEVLGGVKPVAKTEAMTQDVGVDDAGKLYIPPIPTGGTKFYTKTYAMGNQSGTLKSDSNNIDISGYTPICAIIRDKNTGYGAFGGICRNYSGGNHYSVYGHSTSGNGDFEAIVYYVKNENIEALS